MQAFAAPPLADTARQACQSPSPRVLAVVQWTRRAHTMSMMCAAESKRASLVGVAGMVPELGNLLAVQHQPAPQQESHLQAAV